MRIENRIHDYKKKITGIEKTFRGLRSPKNVKRIGVLDIETYGLKASPDAFALGYCIYQRPDESVGHFVSTSLEEFRNFLLNEQHKGITWYAHNGGNYDYLAIFGNLYETFKTDIVFNNGRFILAKYNGIEFADSFNVISASVDEIGKDLGFPKGKTPVKFKYGIKSKVKEEDIEYCKRDCQIIFDALLEIYNETGILGYTISSMAMQYFRYKYFHDVLEIREEDNYFLKAYYGGRVEAYKFGKCDLYCFDINSLYPSAMISTAFPNPETLKIAFNPSPSKVKYILNNFEGCLQADFEHADTYIGYLPVKKDDKLIFPVGKFNSAVCFPEIRYALEKNVIKIGKVDWIVYGKAMFTPFAEYVYDLYKKKQVETGIKRTIYKALLNSLYGKFAEHHEGTKYYASGFNIDDILKLQTEYEDVNWKPISSKRSDGYYECLNDYDTIKLSHSVYCFAAYITSVSRVINLKYQNELSSLGIKVYYTDTDSFFTDKQVPTEFISDEIGSLKLEKKRILEIRGNKDYIYEESGQIKDRVKGVGKRANKLSDNEYRYKQINKLHSSIRKNVPIGSSERVIKKITKRYNKYDKRIVLPDMETMPIKLYSK